MTLARTYGECIHIPYPALRWCSERVKRRMRSTGSGCRIRIRLHAAFSMHAEPHTLSARFCAQVKSDHQTDECSEM